MKYFLIGSIVLNVALGGITIALVIDKRRKTKLIDDLQASTVKGKLYTNDLERELAEMLARARKEYQSQKI